MLIVHVDHIIVIRNDEKEIKGLGCLENKFEIKDFRDLKYFLGIEARSKNRIVISQYEYTLDLLKQTRWWVKTS